MTAQPSIRRTAKITDRDITVLNRYEVKQDCPSKDLHVGDVVLHIRNDKGVEYTTTLRKGTKRHECTCPSYKPCYHIGYGVKIENARWEARQARAARKAAAEAEWAEAVRIAEEARTYGEKLAAIKAAEMAETLAEKAGQAKEAAKVVDLRGYVTEREASRASKRIEDAPLNGASQGFSLMRR